MSIQANHIKKTAASKLKSLDTAYETLERVFKYTLQRVPLRQAVKARRDHEWF